MVVFPNVNMAASCSNYRPNVDEALEDLLGDIAAEKEEKNDLSIQANAFNELLADKEDEFMDFCLVHIPCTETGSSKQLRWIEITQKVYDIGPPLATPQKSIRILMSSFGELTVEVLGRTILQKTIEDASQWKGMFTYTVMFVAYCDGNLMRRMIMRGGGGRGG